MRLLHSQADRSIYRGFVLNDVHHACEKVRMIVADIEKAIGINSDQSFDIRVILSELLQNAIKHGSICKQQNKVFMNVWINGNDTLNITVKDRGRGFDAEKVIKDEQSRQFDEVSELMECGRGLQIVKSLCDDLVFNERGNCITVRKRLT